MPSKRQLLKDVRLLEATIAGKEWVIGELESNLRMHREEATNWRIKYELLLHTPEYKADTEAAFQRGETMATNKFRAWFLKTAQELNDVLQDSNEE